MTLLREYTGALYALLHWGDRDDRGRYVHLDGVVLAGATHVALHAAGRGVDLVRFVRFAAQEVVPLVGG